MDYKVVHNVKELKESAKEGYEFVATITPNDWLMQKREQTVFAFEESTGSDEPTTHSGSGLVSIHVEDTDNSKLEKPKTIKQITDGKDSNTKGSR